MTTESTHQAVPETSANAVRKDGGIYLWVFFAFFNLLDVLLTLYVVKAGLAVEGNPVVAVIGFPAKTALVLILAGLLYKLNPRALLIPCLAYGATLLYTVTGMWLTA